MSAEVLKSLGLFQLMVFPHNLIKFSTRTNELNRNISVRIDSP